MRSLPEGWRKILELNLQKDKKTAGVITLGGAVAALVMGVLMHLRTPITVFFNRSGGVGAYFLRLGVLLAAYLAYVVLHELTHAAVMKAVGGGKVRFGFTGMYAFAGSEEDYFDKTAYRCIALAPLVVWGLVLLGLQLLVSGPWTWVVWLLQIGNVSGAAGDVYVTVKLAPMPGTILVRDTGVDMTVYDRT